MSIAQLFNVPTNEDELLYFSFQNSSEHQKIASAIMSQLGAFTDTFVLDPIPTFDLPNWLRRHQTIHTQVNTVLGQTGADLTDVNLNDPQQLVAWIEIHAQEHLTFNTVLGI